MTPEEGAEAAFARLRSGKPKPKPKRGGRILGTLLAGAAVGGGVGLYHHLQDEERRDEARGARAGPCFDSLVAPRAGRASAYLEAAARWPDDYVQCVVLETCTRSPADPITYFFGLFQRPNSCSRDEWRHASRFRPGLPEDRRTADRRPDLLVDFYRCVGELPARQQDVVLGRLKGDSDEWLASRHDVKPASVRQERGRALRKLSDCMGFEHDDPQ